VGGEKTKGNRRFSQKEQRGGRRERKEGGGLRQKGRGEGVANEIFEKALEKIQSDIRKKSELRKTLGNQIGDTLGWAFLS